VNERKVSFPGEAGFGVRMHDNYWSCIADLENLCKDRADSLLEAYSQETGF